MMQRYDVPTLNTTGLIAFFNQASSQEVSTRLKYFHHLFPYAESLPGSLSLMDHESKILACNDYAWQQVKLENISQMIDYRSDEVEKKLGWRKDLIGQARENDRLVLSLGQSVHHESILDNQYETVLACNKKAIYAENGKPLGVLSLAMPIVKKSRSITMNHDAKKITVHTNENLRIRFSFREYTIIREILHGKSAAEIAIQLSLSPKTIETYVMRVKTKLNCDKQREIIPTLIKYNLASAIFEQALP